MEFGDFVVSSVIFIGGHGQDGIDCPGKRSGKWFYWDRNLNQTANRLGQIHSWDNFQIFSLLMSIEGNELTRDFHLPQF